MAGPTYCSRLWCVMEIFTFLFMRGKLDRIEIHALSASNDASTSLADGRCSLGDLKQQFVTFDAAKAQCFLPQDKHRLLAVIEAGFGDFQEFNRRVRTAFAKRLDDHRTRFLGASRRSRTAAVQLAEIAPNSSSDREESFESSASQGALQARWSLTRNEEEPLPEERRSLTRNEEEPLPEYPFE